MKDVVDAPQRGSQAQHDQEQELVVPEHEGRGDGHLTDLHQADEQHFLHADPDVFDVGRHPADDPADFRAVEKAHRHPLQMGEERDPQVADDGLTQLKGVELAVVHHPLRRQGQHREADGSPDHADAVAPLNGSINHGGDHPGERGQLD